ncbi:MAG: sensor histidine kinase [Flavobacteriaceae bacterium]
MQFKKIVIPYIIKGVLIGVFFPLLALFICVNFLYPDGYNYTITGIHNDFPLMWIIDTAPVVLGVMSYLVGTDVNRRNNVYLSGIQEVNKMLQLKNNEQKKLIKEKEVLLKEVHHRVKNNLQTVTSLLSLQGRQIDNPETEKLFKNCQNRIKSMAMIHEMLYQSQDLSKINYEEYCTKLISELIISMKGNEHNVALHIDVKDVSLGVNTSIPLSLLVNEIITNSLKYGIGGDQTGTIVFKMFKKDDKNYDILIGDDGIGYNEEISQIKPKTLGLKLINRLITQLHGSIEKVKNNDGTYYAITIQEIGT